jgi:hypothetical protein
VAWFVAVLIVAGAAGAVVVIRRVAGVVITRVVGSVLFVAGIASLLTYYRMYWLEGRYADHLHVVAPAVALIGLAAVLFGGRRFSLGGLSLVAGLLAVGCAATASANLPEIGSYERAALTVAALALAFLAVSSGLGAISPYRAAPSRLAAVALALLGAIMTIISGVDAYPIYGEPNEQTISVAVTAAGVTALVVLACALIVTGSVRPLSGAPAPSGGPTPTEPLTPAPVPDRDEAPVAADQAWGGPARAEPAPALPQAPGGGVATVPPPPVGGLGTARVRTGSTGRTRLETAATVVGLITGLIVLVRELLGLLRSLGAG